MDEVSFASNQLLNKGVAEVGGGLEGWEHVGDRIARRHIAGSRSESTEGICGIRDFALLVVAYSRGNDFLTIGLEVERWWGIKDNFVGVGAFGRRRDIVTE